MYLASVQRDSSNPGVDFSVLLEALDAGMDLDDFDTVGRALLSAMAFGLQLGRTNDVSNWPLRHTFMRR